MPPAARRRLDHHRIADPVCDLPGGLGRLQGPVAARHHRHARARHEPARPDLVAHLLDHAPRGPDEDQPGRLAGLGEAPVLGEEAVTGMDGLGIRATGRLEDTVDVEIALARRRGPDEDGFVGRR